MAKESVELRETPEVSKSCSIEMRRYSAGKASSANSDEKIVPRYLRASTGSCHDFCKFGRKHEFEVKDRRSIPNRATRKQLHQTSEESIGGIMTSVARLRASVDSNPIEMSIVKLRESVDSEPQTDSSDTNKRGLSAKSFDSEKQIGNEVLVNGNKTSLVKVKPSLQKSHTSDIPKTMRKEISSTFKEVESPSKSTSMKVETPSKSTSKKVETTSKSTSKKVETPSKSTSKAKTSSTSITKVKTSSKSTSKVVESSSKSSSLKGKEMKLSEKRVTSLKSNSVTRKTISAMNSSEGIGGKRNNEIKMENGAASSKVASRRLMAPLRSSLSPKPSLKRVASINSRNHKSLKIVYHLKNQPTARKVEPAMNSSEGFGGQRSSEIKMEKEATSSKVASKKLTAPLRASLSPKPSLKRVASINARKLKSPKMVSHLKNQPTARKVEPEEHNNNEVEEKTLYVIKMESENKALQYDQNACYDDESSFPQLSSPKVSLSSVSHSSSQVQEESEYTTSEFEEDSCSGNHEIEYMENGETLEVEEKGKPRKDGVVSSEDKGCQVLKLKFRRGKVVENQIEKSSPRRLKFRRTKMLGEKANLKADAQRKSFERRDEACADSTGATTGPEKVVLRHQDMQDKKDAQGLFNNVIEETASKLVETRKSKVKALVGAFETVISLQEKKPAANTVS